MMDLRIFEPYFINHQTIIEYKERSIALSISDILQRNAKNTSETKRHSRLFFKVNMNDSLLVYLMNLQSD